MVNFLSHSVISGFTSGAAITIGLSQMGHMLGYKVTKSHYIHKTLHGLFSKIGDVRFASSRLSFVWQGSLECRGRAQGERRRATPTLAAGVGARRTGRHHKAGR